MQPLIVNKQTYFPVPRGHSALVKKDIRFYVKTNTNSGSEDTLYIHNKDYESYLRQILQQNSGSGVNQLSSASEALLYSFAYQGVNESNLTLLTNISYQITEMKFDDTKSLFNLLINSPELGPGTFRAVICRFIAFQQNWHNPLILNKLINAALFCDLGSVISQQRPHYIVSSEILEVSKLPTDTIQAVRQHHEYLDGSGPLRLKKFNIHPFAKVLRISDELYPYFKANNLLNGVQTLKSMAPEKLDQKLVQCLTQLTKKL